MLGNRLLYSVILENGKADEFETALEARDCGDLIAYYDQDYNVLAETLDVMRGNALRMLWIGSALFALVAALFLLLFFRQTADPARKLRLLGVNAKRVRRQRWLPFWVRQAARGFTVQSQREFCPAMLPCDPQRCSSPPPHRISCSFSPPSSAHSPPPIRT